MFPTRSDAACVILLGSFVGWAFGDLVRGFVGFVGFLVSPVLGYVATMLALRVLVLWKPPSAR